MVIRRDTGSFKCHFQIFEILENLFKDGWRHIMVLLWGHAPRFLCYQVDFLLDFFTEEGSYQWLNDATSFGLLSDKSAEILGWKYLNFCQNGQICNYSLHGCGLNWLRVTSRACAKAIFMSMQKGASMENFQIIKYFDPNISALLAD